MSSLNISNISGSSNAPLSVHSLDYMRMLTDSSIAEDEALAGWYCILPTFNDSNGVIRRVEPCGLEIDCNAIKEISYNGLLALKKTMSKFRLTTLDFKNVNLDIACENKASWLAVMQMLIDDSSYSVITTVSAKQGRSGELRLDGETFRSTLIFTNEGDCLSAMPLNPQRAWYYGRILVPTFTGLDSIDPFKQGEYDTLDDALLGIAREFLRSRNQDKSIQPEDIRLLGKAWNSLEGRAEEEKIKEFVNAMSLMIDSAFECHVIETSLARMPYVDSNSELFAHESLRYKSGPATCEKTETVYLIKGDNSYDYALADKSHPSLMSIFEECVREFRQYYHNPHHESNVNLQTLAKRTISLLEAKNGKETTNEVRLHAFTDVIGRFIFKFQSSLINVESGVEQRCAAANESWPKLYLYEDMRKSTHPFHSRFTWRAPKNRKILSTEMIVERINGLKNEMLSVGGAHAVTGSSFANFVPGMQCIGNLLLAMIECKTESIFSHWSNPEHGIAVAEAVARFNYINPWGNDVRAEIEEFLPKLAETWGPFELHIIELPSQSGRGAYLDKMGNLTAHESCVFKSPATPDQTPVRLYIIHHVDKGFYEALVPSESGE